MTSPELADADRRGVVVLPLAATEQHGPHLPLATDRLIAEGLAAALDAARPGRVLVLPCPPVGYSQHHRAFPGSLSVDHDTLIRYAEQTLACVLDDGFTRVLILNAHGGNQALGGVLLERLGRDHPGATLIFTSWWRAANEELLKLNDTGAGGVGHACEFETSLMLHLHPGLVRTDRIEDGGNRPTFDWAEADLLRGSAASLYRSIDTMTPNGVYGSPRAATADKGARIVAAVTDALTRIVDDLYDHPSPTSDSTGDTP